MPTGYTAELMEKGQDFREFALKCARAFGACIMQRDDPISQLPKTQEPSDYATKAMKEAQGLLTKLKAMSSDERMAEGVRLRREAVESARASMLRGQAEDERIDGMVVKVTAWEPPTEDHKEFKSFMLEQLRISRNGDWYAGHLAELEKRTAESYFTDALLTAARNIDYYAKEHAKELERTRERNDWINALYRSLSK